MDSSLVPLQHHLRSPLQSPQDHGRYLYEHAQYSALQSATNPWSPSAPEPASYQANRSSDGSHLLPSQTSILPHKSTKTTIAVSEGRITRNKAAAIARELREQDRNEGPQPPGSPMTAPSAYDYNPSLPQTGGLPVAYAQSLPASAPLFSYPSHLAPGPPSSSNDTSIPGPNRPPDIQNCTASETDPSSVHHILTNGIDIPNGYMLSAGNGSYTLQNVPAAAYEGPSMNYGSEIMRVPSASPSVASGGRSSPVPEELGSGIARRPPSTRSSSMSHNRSHESYDYGSSGPISPLSSSYGPSALPSSLASMTGGYLHTSPSMQRSLSSTHSLPPTSSEHLIPSTSAASSSSGANARGRLAQKTKTKLTDMDRKFICVYAQNHPKARQEDIATKFNVERSTVSKILKSREKWMKVDFFSSEARTVKHRPSKFPEIEATLINHIRMRVAARETVNDSFIKKLALELAQERGIGKDKFKASSGWVENFKHRHDIRKGGLWEKSSNLAWSMTAGAKYAQDADEGIIGNGLESLESGMSDGQNAIVEHEGDYGATGYSIIGGDASLEDAAHDVEE